MEAPTPKITYLTSRIGILMTDLQSQTATLLKKLGHKEEDVIILSTATHNIVDRKKEKEHHKKKWKVELKDIVKNSVEWDEELD